MAAGPPGTGRIAFSDFVTSQIYAVNPDGTGLAQLTHEPAGVAARWPGWSPDGTRIRVLRFNLSNGGGRIWIMNADGTGPRQLVSDAPGYCDYQPSMPLDGRYIVHPLLAERYGLCAIWIMCSDGTRRRLAVPFIGAPNETKILSVGLADGRRIAFTRFGFDGIVAQVWVASINGEHARPLTAPRLEAMAPELGHRMAAHHVHHQFRPAESSIDVMGANGAGVTRLATSNGRPKLRVRVRAWRGPDRVLERPTAPGPVLRGTLRDACRRHAPAPGGHRHARRLDVAWGSAPLVQTGSPGTLSRSTAAAPAPGAGDGARCRVGSRCP